MFEQPKGRRQRPLIERTRLTRILDAADERTILLHAPAGYGKTTLARQWTKTLSGALWLSMVPAHRDVSAFAHDIAERLGPEQTSFIDEYVRARNNPQRAAREVAGVLAARVEAARVRWIVLDDYHEIAKAPETEEMVEVLQAQTTARFLVSSRTRPRWANARLELYGELLEIGRDTLAMDPAEAAALVGRRGDPAVGAFLTQAQGWPAVLALAAAPLAPRLPPLDVLPVDLHRFLAEELYQSATPELREQLLDLALLPAMTPDLLERKFGSQAQSIVVAARELGFVSTGEPVELHPLGVEFLLAKFGESTNATERVRNAVADALNHQNWDMALELVLRFSLLDLVEPILESAYKPLLRAGRMGTLSHFAGKLGTRPSFISPGVELIDAEVALRDGAYALASDLASRVALRLPDKHPLRSRANAIVGNAGFLRVDFETAEAAFEAALHHAVDDRDEADALFGLALAPVFDERRDSSNWLAALAERREQSPTDLVRHAGLLIGSCRIGPGFSRNEAYDSALHALAHVEDPLVRSGFTANYSYALGVQARYAESKRVAGLLLSDVEDFNLEFARPHAHWNLAFSSLGMRRFREAERHLQVVEDSVKKRYDGHHSLNSRALRARLLIATAQADRALEHVGSETDDVVVPSMRGEYLATRALVLAVLGDEESALDAASRAEKTSIACEVRVLAAAARAILSAHANDVEEASRVVRIADELQTWDPVVIALRADSVLATTLADHDEARPLLQRLYQASNDFGISRKTGLQTRSARNPRELLTPREYEVVGLMARGLRNKEIAAALFIAESTIKVHVRNAFEKLGVTSRTAAAARYQMFEPAD